MMSAEEKPTEEKSAEEKPKNEPRLKDVASFFLYRCKECQSLVPDPGNHSITSEHFRGYIALGPIPIEQEMTEEEIQNEKKATKENAAAVAAKVISPSAARKK
jgi:hypothetical protein